MTRLIDADALKEVIKANHYLLSAKNNSTDYGMFTTGIMQAIDNAPTVIEKKVLYLCKYHNESHYCKHTSRIEDAKNFTLEGDAFIEKDRPKGEWIVVHDKNYGDNVKCPFCGKEIVGTDLNFCVKCGADMRKGAEE